MGCHSSAPVTNPSADITFNVPASYVPNQTYNLTFTLLNDAAGNNGFQVTAQRLSDNAYVANWSGAGVLTTIDTSWWKHSSPGGATVFTVTWTAPPANTGTVRFYGISNKGGTAPGGNFHLRTFDVTEVSPPSISSLTPAFGSVNTTVTIAGSNFGAAVSTVNFTNATSTAPASSWSATAIVVKATGSASGNVTVTNTNGTSSGAPFTLITAAPSISSTTPAFGDRGAGSVVIGITGANISPSAAVVLSTTTPGVPVSSAAATGITVSTTTQATGVTLNLTGMVTGYWTIALTNPDTKSGSLVNGFLVQVKPDAPANLSVVALSSTTLRWNWTTVGNNVDGLRLVSSTGGVMTPNLPAGTNSYDEYGYAPNALAVRAVSAFNVIGSSSSVLLSTATFASLPVSAADTFSAVSAGGLTATWDGNGNVAGTQYDAVVSTATPLILTNGGNVSVSTSPSAAPSAVFTGLLTNTTYFLFVRAVNRNGAPTSYTALSSTATLANPPLTPAVSAAGLTSMSLGWGANGNPAGTFYSAQISTNNFGTINNSSVTIGVTAGFSGLASNTTYYLRVKADNHNSVATAFVVAAASSTAAAAPVSAALSGVTGSAVTANWTANGNSATTLYTAQISSMSSFIPLTDSSATFNTAATFSGLSSNTTYYLQVRALGNDGASTAFMALPTTTTLLQPPGVAGTTYVAVSSNAASIQWTSGGNGAGTTYEASVSTLAGFGTLHASSLTLNTSAVFGAGGQGANLVANTTYYFQVRVLSGPNSSAYVSLGSTTTPVNVPTLPVLTVLTADTAAFDWNAAGNAAGTQYTAQISTEAGFTSPASSVTAGVSAGFSALVPNTTYYARVRAAGAGAAVTAFAVSGASATFAAVPVSAALSAIGITSATANWSANANPAGTLYEIAAGTDSAFSGVILLTTTTAVAAPYANLTANTTYYFRVRVLGHNGTNTALVNLPAAATLANPPLTPAATAAGLASMSLGWGANGNPAGTFYSAQISTNNFGTINNSSGTIGVTAGFSGLASNTTYYLRVKADNRNSVSTAFVLASASSTAVAAPVSDALSGVTGSAVTANWSANGNSPTTLYTAQISSMSSFIPLTDSSATFNTAATFSGLSSNTTYYLQVRALGNDGASTAFMALPATTTLLQPPATAGISFPSVAFASATMQWSAGGNGAGTIYVAQLSSDNFVSVLTSSSTQNLSVWFGAGGAGAALVANTTYYGRVQTTNGANSSVFVNLGSIVTPAFAPTGTAFVSITSSAVSLDWLPNGNPEPGTVYQVYRDVSAGFSAPTITSVSTSAATAAALTPSTTYYFKVRAVSHAGVATAFDAAVSTITLPPAPGQPGAPAGAALGVSSISWTWTAGLNAVGHEAYRAATMVLLGSTGTVFLDTALATNTAYGLGVRGVNPTGAGALSTITTVYTLAAVPATSAVSAVTATSATLSWQLNGNPPGTTAVVEKSTNNAVFTAVQTGPTTTYVDNGLIGCTTYYFRVRHQNGDAVATGFDATVQFRTIASTPTAPVSLAAEPIAGNKVFFQWTGSPTEGITQYKLYYDSGAAGVNYAAPLAVFTSTESSFTTGVLPSTPTYLFALRAVHRCGVEETSGVFASAASIAAVSSVRTAIKSPDSGKKIKGNSVTVLAELTSGSPVDVASVTFQVKAAAATVWTSIPAANANHPNPDPASPYFIHWDTTLLVDGQYDLRAVATNISGSSDTAPSSVRVTIVNAGGDFDVNERVVGAKVVKDQIISNAVAHTLHAAGSGAGDPAVKIVLPAGAVNGSTVTATIISNPAIATAAPSGFTLIGSALQIDLSNGQSILNAPAVLTLSYPDSAAGQASSMQIQSLDTVTGLWSTIGSATLDTRLRTVTAATPHFSVFAIIVGGSGVQSSLSRVRVYPVPYKPNGGNPNEGKPYSAADATSGIIFDRLPAQVKIMIYTLNGRLVAQFETGAGTGTIAWDAKNENGRDAASGGYFAVISSPASKSVVKRLLIIR